MAIAMTLEHYLQDHDVAYELVTHQPTNSSLRTAEVGHVSGDCLAKAVIVKDENGFLLAVLPASHHVQLGALSRLLERRIGLATEDEADRLFTDCAFGAFPAIGPAYGLEVVVDESLDELDEVYFEGGDHECLVHVSGKQFQELMSDARHGCFSEHL